MRKPEPGPSGETLGDASVRAIVAALFVNKPDGGCVESVLTFETHRFEGGVLFDFLAVRFGKRPLLFAYRTSIRND
jgi:hypothetical protein